MDTGCIPPTVNFFQYTSLLCVGWQIRGVGGSVRAVKPIDETDARHFPGDFIVNRLFFCVVIDMNTSAPL